MGRTCKDGWHKFCGFEVLVEDGAVKMAYIPKCGYGRPYRCFARMSGYHNVSGEYDIDYLRKLWHEDKIIFR